MTNPPFVEFFDLEIKDYPLVNTSYKFGQISNIYLDISAGRPYEPSHVTTIAYDSCGVPVRWNKRFRLYCGEYEESIVIRVRCKNTIRRDVDLGAVRIPLAWLADGRRQDTWFKIDGGENGSVRVNMLLDGQLSLPKVIAKPRTDLTAFPMVKEPEKQVTVVPEGTSSSHIKMLAKAKLEVEREQAHWQNVVL